LSYADPMAAFVGTTIESPRIVGSASLAGSLACFATAFSLGFFYLLGSNVMEAVIGALACTIAEALPFGNDNLLIPVMTATAVQIYRS